MPVTKENLLDGGRYRIPANEQMDNVSSMKNMSDKFTLPDKEEASSVRIEKPSVVYFGSLEQTVQTSSMQ